MTALAVVQIAVFLAALTGLALPLGVYIQRVVGTWGIYHFLYDKEHRFVAVPPPVPVREGASYESTADQSFLRQVVTTSGATCWTGLKSSTPFAR